MRGVNEWGCSISDRLVNGVLVIAFLEDSCFDAILIVNGGLNLSTLKMHSLWYTFEGTNEVVSSHFRHLYNPKSGISFYVLAV